MKKFILALSLVTFLSLTTTSCSTDDSGLNDNKSVSADGDGVKDLPKPTTPKNP